LAAEPPEQLVVGIEPTADVDVYVVEHTNPVTAIGKSPLTKPAIAEVIVGTEPPKETLGDEAVTTAAAFATLIVMEPAPESVAYTTRSLGRKSADRLVAELAALGVHSHVATSPSVAILLQPAIATPLTLKVTEPAVLVCAEIFRVVP
jgi:hypothetical protein